MVGFGVASRGNSAPAGVIDEAWILTLGWRHAVDNALCALEFTVDVNAVQSVGSELVPGNFEHQIANRGFVGAVECSTELVDVEFYHGMRSELQVCVRRLGLNRYCRLIRASS